jgi:hypothetical protein
MPASANPIFEPPSDPQVKLWRYMDFTKFVSMLENGGLFFSRADRLGDPFEGTFPKNNVIRRSALLSSWGHPQASAKLSDHYAQWRKWMDICCWHMNEHESAAMWKLYARTNEAIAICSTFQKLWDALDDTCYVGKVNYIDYDVASVPDGNQFYRFLHKRLSFSHENELRAVILQHPPKVPKEEGFTADFAAERESSGTWKSLDLTTLIDDIRVAPTSPSWFKQLVEQVLKRYSLRDKPVRQSRLDEAPFF